MTDVSPCETAGTQHRTSVSTQNTRNNQSNEEKIVLLNKYLKLFTNETLRQAEKRVEKFNKLTYNNYNT